MNDDSVAIRVDGVSKRFVIRKEKSLKERLLNLRRSNLHKEDFYALRDVSLDIHQGTTVGLIGPNGSGKSTLLKTIGGIIQPTTGTVQHRGRVAALLELGAGFHPDLTGRENVYLNAAILGLSQEETERNFSAILDFASIGDFIDTQVKFYSSGMYVRLAFAVAVHVDPDILIVDEVLAVGDEPFQRKCLDRIRDLQRQGRTIVIVTHALDQVAALCDRAVVLEAGHIAFDGEPGLAIQALRKDFETIRQEKVQAAAPAEIPKEASRITGVTVRSLADDVPLDVLDSGAGIVVEVSLSLAESTDAWLVGMGIETAIGQVVFGTSSELMGSAQTRAAGEVVFRFEIEDLHLGAGQYSVHASFGTLDQGELFRVPQAAVFSVNASPRSEGVLSAPVTGRMLKAQAPHLNGLVRRSA